MNSRERLRLALNHKQPDRVPMDLGSTPNSSIKMTAYKNLINHLGLNIDVDQLTITGKSRNSAVVNPDEQVLKHLGIDTRGVSLGSPENWIDDNISANSYKDQWGVTWHCPPNANYYSPIKFPLSGDISISDVKNYHWPKLADDLGYTCRLREDVLRIVEKTDFGIVLHLQGICVHISQFLRGLENWYMDFYLNPEVICFIMDIILDLRLALAEKAINLVGDLIDVVSCSDDVADQRGPIISPEMYKKFIKPRHRLFFDMIHKKTEAKVLFHSCGSVIQLIPDFIDIGVDFINPVQVSAKGMDDTAYLKREFGNEIGFWGAIDNVHVLPNGTPKDVFAEVKRRVDDLSVNGGYVLAAVHNIQPDVPSENIVAMFNANKAK